MFYRWLKALIGKNDLPKSPPHEKEQPAEKFFSLRLGDFLNQFGDKDSDPSVGSSQSDDASEVEQNPMLDSFKRHKKAEKPDMHESSDGEKQNVWSESDAGDKIGHEQGNGEDFSAEQAEKGDSISGISNSKLGRQNQHSRISAKLSSVVSESDVPEKVVFNEIGQATKIFDWRRILRQNGSFEVDWSYRNAVIDDGIVRPTLETVPVAVTEILLDTSGSIDEPLLKRFLQECKNIMPYSKVKVGCFDTQFYGFKTINSLSDLENMVFEGRHGTSFTAAVGAFSGRADNRIIFTDGDAPMPAQRMDIIWIVFGGKRIKPNGGRVFYVDDDLLSRMKSED